MTDESTNLHVTDNVFLLLLFRKSPTTYFGYRWILGEEVQMRYLLNDELQTLFYIEFNLVPKIIGRRH